MSTIAAEGITPGADDSGAGVPGTDPAGSIPGDTETELALGDRPGPRDVRAWVTAMVIDLDDEVLEDLLLVVTELVSNAYDHAPHPVMLRLFTGQHRIRVEVVDTSPEPPVLGRSRIHADRGRGLVLVDALSVEWGHHGHIAGKVLWAEIAHG